MYYTPAQVVRAQVNLISTLLQNSFGKPLAFADENVVALDPAAGTGTYPLAAIQHGLDLATRRFGAAMAGNTAAKMARNIHAFELLVGPYAVAHLRLSERVMDAGGTLPEDGVHVYLTDALESPHASPPGRFPLVARELTEEHERALAVKKDTEVLVCFGNPPYDRQQIDPSDEGVERKGGWVRNGDDENERPLLEDFLQPAREAGAGVHLKNLYNDYVYFWRWALWKVFEAREEPGPGIVSFITASSYLRGPGFVGMREVMRRTFDELWIIDLEGDNLGARKTENVFNIQTPVAIAVGVRHGEPKPDEPARVRYAKITGSREEKLAALNDVAGFDDLDWRGCMEGWQNPFLPAGEGDYFAWPPLTDVFPWQHSGVEMKRTWPIGGTKEVLQRRWAALLTAGDRKLAFREADRKISKKYGDLDDPARKLSPISDLPADTPMQEAVLYSFRSFDRQLLIKDARLGDRMRPQLWWSHGEQQVYMSGMLTDVLGIGPAATISTEVPDRHHFSGRGGKDVIPLWRDSAATEPNVTGGLLEFLSEEYGGLVSAEEIFAYAYAVLASPAYTESFSEELAIPGPRLPITRKADLFRRGVELGRALIHLHTYGERFTPENDKLGVPQGRARYEKPIPETPDGYPEDFDYDEASETLRVGAGEFRPVGKAVWEYEVSGLRPLRSWLGYRMKDPAGKSSSPLDEIRPERWTGEMTMELLELLWVLEATIEKEPELAAFLQTIVESPTFEAAKLPQPTDAERKPPEKPAEPVQEELGPA